MRRFERGAIRPMTQANNRNEHERLRGNPPPPVNEARPDADPPGIASAAVPLAIFLFIALFTGVDMAGDLSEGASVEHLIGEAAITLLSLGGLGAMWRLLRAAMRRTRELEVALDGTRADVLKWRSEAQELLRGLGAAIDRQFDGWGLSPAEREVGLLLLKGLSLREVADTRKTSERTVRQQALAVYRKAGLAGRAELAAFFLEDLLLPHEPLVAAPPERG
jgi:DNA-binding CsgD family transcriptional regulator